MTSFPLFGGISLPENKHLVEFRAGKMTMKNKTVKADKRRGVVFMYQAEDSLMHFCWKDRKTGVVEDDLILFPGDAVFKRVPECTTGRVYVMKFKLSSKRFFYWLQEPKTDHDDEICHKVNLYMNNPFASGSSGAESPDQIDDFSTASRSNINPISALNSLDNIDFQNIINNMSHQQLIQLLNEVEEISNESSSSSIILNGQSDGHNIAETSDPAGKSQPVEDNFTSSSSETTTSDSTCSVNQNNSENNSPKHFTSENTKNCVDLSSVITTETLEPLINCNKDLLVRIENFLPSLPDSENKIQGEHLKSTMRSPEFKFALRTFGEALQKGYLGPLMREFGLSSEVIAAADFGDLDAFVIALQNSTEESTPENTNENKKQDEN